MDIRICAITYLDAGILVVNKDGDIIVPIGARPASNELWISTDDRIAHARRRAALSESIKSIDYFGSSFLAYARLITLEDESVLDAIARLGSRIFSIAAKKLNIADDDLLLKTKSSHTFSSVISSMQTYGVELYVDHEDEALLQELDHASMIQSKDLQKNEDSTRLRIEPHYLLSRMLEAQIPFGILREIEFRSESDLMGWLGHTNRPFLVEVAFTAVSKALKDIHKPGYFLKKRWVSHADFFVFSRHAKMKIERCFIADGYKASGSDISVYFDSIDAFSVSSGVFASCLLDGMITSNRAQFEDEDSRVTRRFWVSSALRAILFDISMALIDDGLEVLSFGAGGIDVDSKNTDMQTILSAAYHQNCEILN